MTRIVGNDRSDSMCSNSRLKSLMMINKRNFLPSYKASLIKSVFHICQGEFESALRLQQGFFNYLNIAKYY